MDANIRKGLEGLAKLKAMGSVQNLVSAAQVPVNPAPTPAPVPATGIFSQADIDAAVLKKENQMNSLLQRKEEAKKFLIDVGISGMTSFDDEKELYQFCSAVRLTEESGKNVIILNEEFTNDLEKNDFTLAQKINIKNKIYKFCVEEHKVALIQEDPALGLVQVLRNIYPTFTTNDMTNQESESYCTNILGLSKDCLINEDYNPDN